MARSPSQSRARPEWVDQGCVQPSSECLQGWRLAIGHSRSLVISLAFEEALSVLPIFKFVLV